MAIILISNDAESNFVLRYDSVIRLIRGNRVHDSYKAFRRELKSGFLKQYRGTYVAYKEGAFCGQGKDRDELESIARAHIGGRISVYKVPED